MGKHCSAAVDAARSFLTAEIMNGSLTADQAAAKLASLADTIMSSLGVRADRTPAPNAQTPAVPIEESVHPDYIVCLEDGMKVKMLRRHLKLLGLTPETYRAKWGLPDDYPMTAPDLGRRRRGGHGGGDDDDER